MIKTATRTKRKIVLIDEAKCNGCGACATKCAEGAITIIDGKAKLVSETYCDGLGACLGECPEGAITIVEREADAFDEHAVEQHLKELKQQAQPKAEPLPCGCPGSSVREIHRPAGGQRAPAAGGPRESQLSHWPVQLALVPPHAPFLRGADVVLAAHCAPFAYADFHQDFLSDHSLVIACPKLDDADAHLEKLTNIFSVAEPRSVTIVHMEVPCCSGLVYLAQQALKASGKNIPLREVTIGVRGDIKD